MSPISNNQVFRRIPTSIDLNGPILSITENPTDATGNVDGSVTFTGNAEVSFPGVTDPANSGTLTFRWHEVNVGPLSDGDGITGTATTTLTISDLHSPTDNGRSFFMRAGYTPSQETGSPLNAPVDTTTATLTVNPLIEIVAQPPSITSTAGVENEFTVVGGLTDTSFGAVSFQWFLDGEALTDGTITDTTPATRVTRNLGSFTLPADASDVVVTANGAKGGNGGSDNNGPGGSGGRGRGGRFTFPDGAQTLRASTGSTGNGGGSCFGSGGGGGGGDAGGGGGGKGGGCSGSGGGGGGSTAVYRNNTRVIQAGGGGGGGGGSWNRSGGNGSNAGGFGGGGTPGQGGGNGGSSPGQDGGGGGGGGGGTSGGSGGGGGSDNGSGGGGGGGGGSGYNSGLLTNTSSWENDGGGSAQVSFTTNEDIPGSTIEVTRTTVVSGSNTATLTIETDTPGTQELSVRLSSGAATNSPLDSDTVFFTTIPSQDEANVTFESIGDTAGSGNVAQVNLNNGDFEVSDFQQNAPAGTIVNFISMFSPDRDIDVEMDLFGGRGTNSGNFNGGEGGFSRIRFTLDQNVEYVITGLDATINTPFVYRQGTLIATVGRGGNAGPNGRGGFGGGIGVAGQNGGGANAGQGGASFTAGNLPNSGVFGSIVDSPTLISPDTAAEAPDGGQALPCPRGDFWRDQGVAPCATVGNTQFRLADGTIVTATATIARGYKAGYSIIETAGQGITNGGTGGYGATGGQGGTSGAGGGGGSGYTDGSVTVVSTQLGGSEGAARVLIREVSTEAEE